MKFVSDKKTLLSLIIPAASASSNKSTLPALEGVLFTLKGETLTVCGYDLEKGVRTIDKAPRDGAEGLSIAFLHPKSTQGVLTELCEEKK